MVEESIMNASLTKPAIWQLDYGKISFQQYPILSGFTGNTLKKAADINSFKNWWKVFAVGNSCEMHYFLSMSHTP